MCAGKINKALEVTLLRILLDLDDVIPDSSNTNFRHTTTHEILIEKHPPGKPAPMNSMLQGFPTQFSSRT